MVAAAGDRPCIEMGSRRTHEEAAVAAARAAYLAGFATTSNLAAGRRYGVPTAGTARTRSPCCTTPSEAAFPPRSTRSGVGTTLLVDTYDIADGLRTAVEVAGPELGAVRIDSGDLPLAADAAQQLDALGATTPGSWSRATSTSTPSPRCRRSGRRLRRRHRAGHRLGCAHGRLVYKLVARATGTQPDAPLVGVAKR